MTHRKTIIWGFIWIATLVVCLLGWMIHSAVSEKELLVATIGIISNIISAMAGMYIGKTKEDLKPPPVE